MQPWIATRPASWSLILPGEFETDLLLFFDRFLFDRMYVDPTLLRVPSAPVLFPNPILISRFLLRSYFPPIFSLVSYIGRESRYSGPTFSILCLLVASTRFRD